MDYKKKYEKYKEKYLALKASNQEGGQGTPGDANSDAEKEKIMGVLKNKYPEMFENNQINFKELINKVLGDGPLDIDDYRIIIMYTDGGYSLVGKNTKKSEDERWNILYNINQ